MNELEIFKKKLDLVELGHAMKEIEQVECPEQHDFAEGVYVRTIFIPRDTLVLGKIHRFETCNIILKGEISVYMGEGKSVKRMKAPCIFTSKPGVRKLGYTHKDTIFSNIHPTNETDLEIIEHEFIMPEQEQIDCEEQICLG